ncbi:hypothetical protein [Nocardia altamirensis]|uniref:hypothetical protein n=1 Tax=Nocardia altamirensis TaxID=472158 RepID=UPI0014354817|nr:hypothetical protein [Nocardia altamirensis]
MLMLSDQGCAYQMIDGADLDQDDPLAPARRCRHHRSGLLASRSMLTLQPAE